MFKFAKYFFIVFLMTTLLPLVLMFAWNNTQMDKFHSTMSQNALNTGKIKIENALENNLKMQEGDILKRLYLTEDKDLSFKNFKEILKDYDVETIDYPVKKLNSYYEGKDFDIFACTVLPYKSSYGLKIRQKVNLEVMRPAGPYNLDLEVKQSGGTEIRKALATDPMAMGLPEKSKFKFLIKKTKTYTDTIDLKNDKDESFAKVYITLSVFSLRAKLDSFITGLNILFIGIISSFVIGLIVNKNFVLPLLGLSKATKEIKKGNLSFKLKTDTKDKIIGNIYDNFNDMAENLEVKEKLRQSFISNLTHDLRTPLVAQSQSLEFIFKKFKELGLENEYELAESLAKNNEHLLKMVNLILESYCFDPSKLKLNIEKINLYEIVEDCRHKLRPLINDKKIAFINDIDPNCQPIDGDLTNLTRVFVNLLSNALENTSEDKFIKIGANYTDKDVVITIEDNGNGISAEDLKYIFERYYSGKSLERKLGSGFGLSVCEKLITMHGGSVSVASEVNKFTKFTITLPMEADKQV